MPCEILPSCYGLPGVSELCGYFLFPPSLPPSLSAPVGLLPPFYFMFNHVEMWGHMHDVGASSGLSAVLLGEDGEQESSGV